MERNDQDQEEPAEHPKTREALKKAFNEKAKEFYDIISKAKGQQDEMYIRLQDHFRQAELIRIRTLPGHVPQPQVSTTGRVSTRIQLHTETFRKRFIQEAIYELERRYKAYGRARQVLERFASKTAKLQSDLAVLSKRMSMISNAQGKQVRGTKLDAGIVQGQLSLAKIQECMSASIGHNSLYYTISHGSKQIYTSEKYHLPKKDGFQKEGQLRPIWNEFFSFNLTGEVEESLVFEVFRHNSCEGDLQLDAFEVKLQEDPGLFKLLADQNNHFLTYSSAINSATNHPSFEIENTQSSNDEPLNQSTFKVLFKWRHSELELKAAHIRRQITLIESKRFDEEQAMKESLDKYTRFLQFKNQGPSALLALWGIAPLPKRAVFKSPRPKPPQLSAPRISSPIRPMTSQRQDSLSRASDTISGRSSPYRARAKPTLLGRSGKNPSSQKRSQKSSCSDNPYQFNQNEINATKQDIHINKQDINLVEMLGSQQHEGLKEMMQNELKRSFISQKPPPLKLLRGTSPGASSLVVSAKKRASRNLPNPQHKILTSSSFKVKTSNFLDSLAALRGSGTNQIQTERGLRPTGALHSLKSQKNCQSTTSIKSGFKDGKSVSNSSHTSANVRFFNIPKPVLEEKMLVGTKFKKKKKKTAGATDVPSTKISLPSNMSLQIQAKAMYQKQVRNVVPPQNESPELLHDSDSDQEGMISDTTSIIRIVGHDSLEEEKNPVEDYEEPWNASHSAQLLIQENDPPKEEEKASPNDKELISTIQIERIEQNFEKPVEIKVVKLDLPLKEEPIIIDTVPLTEAQVEKVNEAITYDQEAFDISSSQQEHQPRIPQDQEKAESQEQEALEESPKAGKVEEVIIETKVEEPFIIEEPVIQEDFEGLPEKLNEPEEVWAQEQKIELLAEPILEPHQPAIVVEELKVEEFAIKQVDETNVENIRRQTLSPRNMTLSLTGDDLIGQEQERSFQQDQTQDEQLIYQQELKSSSLGPSVLIIENGDQEEEDEVVRVECQPENETETSIVFVHDHSFKVEEDQKDDVPQQQQEDQQEAELIVTNQEATEVKPLESSDEKEYHHIETSVLVLDVEPLAEPGIPQGKIFREVEELIEVLLQAVILKQEEPITRESNRHEAPFEVLCVSNEAEEIKKEEISAESIVANEPKEHVQKEEIDMTQFKALIDELLDLAVEKIKEQADNQVETNVLPECILYEQQNRPSSPQMEIETVEEPIAHDFVHARYKSLISADTSNKPYMKPGVSCIIEASDSKMEASSRAYSEQENRLQEDTEFFNLGLEQLQAQLFQESKDVQEEEKQINQVVVLDVDIEQEEEQREADLPQYEQQYQELEDSVGPEQQRHEAHVVRIDLASETESEKPAVSDIQEASLFVHPEQESSLFIAQMDISIAAESTEKNEDAKEVFEEAITLQNPAIQAVHQEILQEIYIEENEEVKAQDEVEDDQAQEEEIVVHKKKPVYSEPSRFIEVEPVYEPEEQTICMDLKESSLINEEDVSREKTQDAHLQITQIDFKDFVMEEVKEQDAEKTLIMNEVSPSAIHIEEEVHVVEEADVESKEKELILKEDIDNEIKEEPQVSVKRDEELVSINQAPQQIEVNEEPAPPEETFEVKRSGRIKASTNFKQSSLGFIQREVYFIERRQPTHHQMELVEATQPLKLTIQSQNAQANQETMKTEEENEEDRPFLFLTDLEEQAQQNQQDQVELQVEEQKIDYQQDQEDLINKSFNSHEDRKSDQNSLYVDKGEEDVIQFEPAQQDEEGVEVLQPTLANLKKIGLKNQRKDLEGSIATSNIVELIQRYQVNRSQVLQLSDDNESFQYRKEEPKTTKNNPIVPRISFAGLGLSGVSPFGMMGMGMKMGAKSVLQDPIEQVHNKSVYSGKSAGAKSIGFLMKSLDGGAHISRLALNKQIARQNSEESSDYGMKGLKIGDEELSAGGNSNVQASGDQNEEVKQDSHENQPPVARMSVGALSQGNVSESGESKEAKSLRLGKMFMAPLGYGGLGLQMNARSNSSQYQ